MLFLLRVLEACGIIVKVNENETFRQHNLLLQMALCEAQS